MTVNVRNWFKRELMSHTLKDLKRLVSILFLVLTHQMHKTKPCGCMLHWLHEWSTRYHCLVTNKSIYLFHNGQHKFISPTTTDNLKKWMARQPCPWLQVSTDSVRNFIAHARIWFYYFSIFVSISLSNVASHCSRICCFSQITYSTVIHFPRIYCF